MQTVPDELVALAHRLAEAAGAVQRRYFRTPVAVDSKSDDSPVTIADREAEAAMRELIARHFPDHGVLGEEHGSDRLDAEFVWVLDPIDGTKAFITGRPQFGTLIALCHGGRPVLGVIDQTITGERWVGRAGAPSTMNGAAIATRPCSDPARAVLCATSPYMFAEGDERAAFERLARQVRMPLFGGDCYAYGLLAMGFVDLVVEAGLGVYDYMALVPVIEGAGGRITDWEGRPPGFGSDGRVVAAGDGRTHEAVLRLLGEKTAS
ncbi:histidinol-phosphatase [Geminicoccaceae bacterium 1502E]|nr:histidinol-phosphatase [Geminicoccaceae bacterium 1502E]